MRATHITIKNSDKLKAHFSEDIEDPVKGRFMGMDIHVSPFIPEGKAILSDVRFIIDDLYDKVAIGDRNAGLKLDNMWAFAVYILKNTLPQHI